MAKDLKLVAVGFQMGRISNWESFVAEVKAPRNYKDKGKIEAYEAEARARQAEDSAENPATAGIVKLVAVTTNTNGERGLTSFESLDELLTKYRDAEQPCLLVVPNGSLLFETALIDAVADNRHAVALTALQVSSMFPKVAEIPAYVDPLRVFKQGTRIDAVLPLLRRLKVECKEYAVNTAEWWAHIGYTLAERLNLDEAVEALAT